MEENKKFDLNSIIGFALIGLIMFVYFNWFMPKVEEQPIKEQTEQQIVEEKKNVSASTPAMTGGFTSSTAEQEISLENNELSLIFSSKGAKIKTAQVKQYQSYEKEKKDHRGTLFLITEDNADFNIKFVEKGQIVNTRDLIFEVQQNGSQVTFSTQTQSGGKLKILYALKKNYLVDFDVQSEGLAITEKPNLQFNLKALAHEKGRTEELRRTEFYYALDNLGDIDYTQSDADEIKVDWIAYKGQFFSVILDNEKAFDTTKMVVTNVDDSLYLKQFKMESTFAENALNANMQWYLGPNDRDVMKLHERDYEEIIPFGWFIFGILNKGFFIPMYKFLAGLGWFGAGIVVMIMTIIVKLVTAPIMYKQYKQGAIMRVLRPELDEINEKHKDSDAMKKQQATMELYRKAGVNPMAGCIPALLQMPIFLALFNLFPNLINLRGEPFLWADDLSAYDSIVEIPFNIPMYGAHVSLFTLLYAATMFIYTRLSSSNMQQPTQPGMPDMRFIMYLMPFMLVIWINSYASALSWYYFVSNTISIILVLVIKRFFIDEDKIHAQLQENKKKTPKKKSRFAQMLEDAQKQQAQQAASRKKK